LLGANAAELAALVGPRAEIVELGAGSSMKASVLASLDEPASYMPVDISAEYLAEQAAGLRPLFRRRGASRLGRFHSAIRASRLPTRERALVFFQDRRSAISRGLAARHWPRSQSIGGALLLGVDLCHDPAVLHAAYNDARGVLRVQSELLTRMNRELDAIST
jgi:uncharacterized SAM-dependent methyltransferase